MAIIKQLNKKTGVTYVFESRSYRDKTTKQPRSERHLIGKIDPITGEIVPTRKKASKRTTCSDEDVSSFPSQAEQQPSVSWDSLQSMNSEMTELRNEVARLQTILDQITPELEKIITIVHASQQGPHAV